MSELVQDLRTPNPAFSAAGVVSLADRDSLLFWKIVSLILAAVVLCLLADRMR